MSDTHPNSHDDGREANDKGDEKPRVDLGADGVVTQHGALVIVKDVAVRWDVDEEESDSTDDQGEPVIPLDIDLLVLAPAEILLADKVLTSSNGSTVNPDPESNSVLL